ncbi:MAG: YdcF family protein [Proteobacteria bacterium]|nr:YdcF family protein [Pseudomonadota bacterium]
MHKLGRALGWLVLGLALFLAALALYVWQHAQERLSQPQLQPADAALVLGNRAYLEGRPNPCLTNRVDRGVQLWRDGRVRLITLSGGVDREDGRVEAEVMAVHARADGYSGVLLKESLSSSTRENLAMSWPLLEAAGVRRVIVVSDAYHLWRVERLAKASGFDGAFEVQYAAAPADCGRPGWQAMRSALREPLAIVNNALNGYL